MVFRETSLLSLFCMILSFNCVLSEDIDSIPNDVPLPETNFVKTDYVVQPLDHFNPLTNHFWKQKYFVNEQFHEIGNPVFVLLGGETPIDESWLQVGSMIELCKKLKGIAFMVEHRFVGGSFPINNTNLKSLSYMTVQQALADYANFIHTIKSSYSLQGNKVIVVGGSYPGGLAVHMRTKYPHLVDIVWASSPIITHAFNFPEYFDLTGRVINDISSDCYASVEEGFNHLEKIIWNQFSNASRRNSIDKLQNSKGKRKNNIETCPIVEENFNLCEPLNINNEDDIRNFFQYLSQHFHNMVQYNGRRLEYLMDDICQNIFENKTGGLDAVQKLSKFIDLVNKKLGYQCTDFSQKKFCGQLREVDTTAYERITAGAFDDSRQWWWLTCSQIGNLQSSDGINHPFGRSIPVSFMVKQCQCVFGKRFTKEYMEAQFRNLQTEFGEIESAKFVSNVIFVNGANDPWVSRGVLHQNQTTPENRVIVIKGASHCFDLLATKSTDAPQVTAARLEIHSQIKNWLLKKK